MCSYSDKGKIGAELKWLSRTKSDFKKIVQENPFGEHYLYDRIHVIFYQESIQSLPLDKLKLITVKKKFVLVTTAFTSISLELLNKRNSIPTILKSFLM